MNDERLAVGEKAYSLRLSLPNAALGKGLDERFSDYSEYSENSDYSDNLE